MLEAAKPLWARLRERVRPGALIAIVAAAVVATIVIVSAGDDDEPVRATPEAASTSRLERLAARSPFPLYWAGEVEGHSFELSRTSDDSVYIRYLPEDVGLGDERPEFLTVGTYPVEDAANELRKQASKVGARLQRTDDGALTFSDPANPASVYFAYPQGDFEVEVFDPDPGRAQQLLADGQIQPIR